MNPTHQFDAHPAAPNETPADLIQRRIPRPPADIVALRDSFSRMVAKQWDRIVPADLRDAPLGLNRGQAAKVRFMARMYMRACYSALLVSSSGPAAIRIPVLVASRLPIKRDLTIRCGEMLLKSFPYLIASEFHRQLALMTTLMGVMDIALDEAAPPGMMLRFGLHRC